MYNRTKLKWKSNDLTSLTLDEAISLYANTPLCIIGIVLCIVSALVLSNKKFKEKSYQYIKIQCYLMASDLAIVAFRSIISLFVCFNPNFDCFGINPPITMVKVFVFMYLPSLIEASILVASIMAVLIRFVQLKLKKRKGLLIFVLSAKPHRVIISSFAVFGLLFSYQLFFNTNLFHIDFFHRNIQGLSIMTFAIRDCLLLAILIVINIMTWLRIRTSMQKKVNMNTHNVQRRAIKAKSRINVIVLSTCVISIASRLPIFFFIIIHATISNVFIPGFFPLCITMLSISYSSTFIFFFVINKNFRDVFFGMFSHRKPILL